MESGWHERERGSLSRRGLLAKGAAVGAVALGGSALTGVGGAFAAPKPSLQGYRIGDAAAEVSGFDQYMKNRKLSDSFGSWVLLDLCPVWCQPCAYSAQWHRPFTEYVRGKGIPFRVQPMVVEANSPGAPSTRRDAERWAVKFELEHETLMHANGDAKSPLLELVNKYAAANNNPEPAYPTYVLIDPKGIIRDYILGADMNAVQASLAALTGKTLDLDWFDESLIPSYEAVVDTSVGSAGFRLWDGTEVSMPGPSSHIENDYGVFDVHSGGEVRIDLTKLGDPVPESGPPRDPSKVLDLHSPVTVTFRATLSPPPGSYRRVAVTSPAWFEEDSAFHPDGAVLKGTATVTEIRNSDGSITATYQAPDDFNMWSGLDDDSNASNVTGVLIGAGAAISPYSTALDLDAAIAADGTLSKKTRSTVSSLLSGGCAKLANRDHAGSAAQFRKAVNALKAESSDWAVAVSRVADHVEWLVTH